MEVAVHLLQHRVRLVGELVNGLSLVGRFLLDLFILEVGPVGGREWNCDVKGDVL